MAKQSKNKVKLEKKYKTIGHIPMAALHLHFELKENFWLVTSVHAIRPKELERMILIWKK